MPNSTGPIDPAASPKWALAGRIVTMDPKSTVVMDGAIWIADAAIAAITKRGDPTPEGFDGVVPLETGGTVFPGLIELHNHIAYNALPLWNVPEHYTNRNQWGNAPAYHQLVTAPMKTIGEATDLLPALVRYVECKSLVGGVTTTQGIALFSAPGVRRYYRGIVRNVEETGDKALPEAGSRIADVDANDPQAFLAEIEKKTCFLLHLSEGTDTPAHQHFEALTLPGDKWAIAPSLAGIHCVALAPADFEVMASHGASMVWSPFSNLLLYGQTANVAAAIAASTAGTPFKIGLGSDWSTSGSKSLFGELKVARVYSQHNGNVFGDEQIVRLATTAGAEILGWDESVGSLEVGKRADIVVIAGQNDTAPLTPLFEGDERSVQMVSINGTPRYGTPAMLVADGPGLETIAVGGESARALPRAGDRGSGRRRAQLCRSAGQARRCVGEHQGDPARAGACARPRGTGRGAGRARRPPATRARRVRAHRLHPAPASDARRSRHGTGRHARGGRRRSRRCCRRSNSIR